MNARSQRMQPVVEQPTYGYYDQYPMYAPQPAPIHYPQYGYPVEYVQPAPQANLSQS